jgi:hypothetical protein
MMKAMNSGRWLAGLAAALLAASLFSCARGAVEPGVRDGLREAEGGRWEEALAGWRDAVQAGGGSAALHNNLAVAYEQAGLRDDAAREYQAALRLAPDNPCILRNREGFSGTSGAGPKIEDSGEALAAEGKDGAERVVIMVRYPALLAADGLATVVVAGFRQEGGVAGFDAAAQAEEWAAAEIRRLVKAEVVQPQGGPGREIRPGDAAAWRRLGAPFREALIVAGAVRLDRAVEKSLRETDLPKDGPFKVENRGLTTRTRYSLALGLDFISAETGALRLHRDIRQTMNYDSLWESSDIALQAMLVEARNDVAAVFSGQEKAQTRYLLRGGARPGGTLSAGGGDRAVSR